MPCCLNWLRSFDILGITQPNYPHGCAKRLLAWLCLLPTAVVWLPLACHGVILPNCCGHHKQRSKWAVTEWGSDHLPLACTIRPA